ncbi:MAG: hypothetical protein ACYSWQ_14465 [Planctomycetota bacterium]|jgi:hypothetical protein
MKISLIVFALFVSASWLGGCAVFVDKGAEGSAEATIAEIDAVSKLSFASERKEAYEEIAVREGLTARAQVRLIEAILDNLAHDSAKQEVLLTLIANPDFSNAAEREILERIDGLAFESSKEKVLKAISDRKT